MSINRNNETLNEILEIINNLPSSDGVGGGITYTNIVYNDDNTITLTDKDGADHIMTCEYEDGSLSALTYDGKSIALTYEEDALVGIGAVEVDMANVPCDAGGGEEEDFVGIKYSDFTGTYNKPKIADARSLSVMGVDVLNNIGNLFYSVYRVNDEISGFNRELETIYFPDKLKRIAKQTFNSCDKLINLYGDFTEVEEVAESAFNGCMKMNTPKMPKLKILGKWAFGSCYAIKEFKFYTKAESIDAFAFEGCNNLKDIYCPWAEGTNVGGDAPWGATNATVWYEVTYDADGNPLDKDGNLIVSEV